jgi:multiple sugar transport system ATP-binding protein
LSKIVKNYGAVEVIKTVDLSINTGEFVVFVGPSGCGKSTLLRMVAGLEPITSGTISIGGKIVNDIPPADRGIAMVFQSYALYPHMTVFGNMAYSLKLKRLGKAAIQTKVHKAAAKLQLMELLDRYPRELSGGQRQRVAIGRSIVRDPGVFLFDEPLSNLDASLRVQMRMELAQLHMSLPDTTMIYVTHDQVEAMTMADRIVVLNGGVIEQVGTPLELYQNPKSVFVAKFIGSPRMNLLSGEFAAELDGATIGIRPEDIVMNDNGIWRGKVIYSENLGSDNFVFVDIGAAEPLIVRQPGQTDLTPGETFNTSPVEGKFHSFDEYGARL